MLFRLAKNLILIGVVVFLGFYFRVEIAGAIRIFEEVSGITKPCDRTVRYSVGRFDTGFGLTQKQFLTAAKTAADIWETPVGKNLLEYAPDGDLKLNLVYDYRQQATAKLRELGIVIKDDKATYETVKEKYSSLSADYQAKKAVLERMVAAYDAKKRSYEDEVAYWNARGGAPKDEFRKLEDERRDLNNDAAGINLEQSNLNDLVSSINSTVSVLNQLAKTLNLTVSKYNTIGQSTGEEFDAGEYMSSRTGESITVYQFENYDKLVRVLEHEFGHALGLEHSEDPKAIMYRLNSGNNNVLTANDIAELKQVCHIQ